MKTRLLSVIALALILTAGLTWGQNEMKIVIEPGQPDLNDLITISITNTKCAVHATVQEFESGLITITLTIYDWDCLDPGPDATDYETTIGPLEVGDYSVVFRQVLDRGARIADQRSFTVGLPEGGINGLYYEAEADGHYVTLQEVRPNEYFMHWLTFDHLGNQAWVFALGSREGDTITAKAYFNPKGRLTPGGGARVDMRAQQDWGTIVIQLFTCRTGEFRYESSLRQFGSGRFPLDRLAFIEGLGCESN